MMPSKGPSAGTACSQITCPQFPTVLPCFKLWCSSPCWEVLGGKTVAKVLAQHAQGRPLTHPTPRTSTLLPKKGKEKRHNPPIPYSLCRPQTVSVMTLLREHQGSFRWQICINWLIYAEVSGTSPDLKPLYIKSFRFWETGVHTISHRDEGVTPLK